ncbi:CGNR zinc finger domain-containing protein [Chitinophaga vietnamensis]|uniref:CGNR zinc finger domain-containing protein n=1 Tax=Chitinophaga vietnamensis TaxID=2593957 RepID=UPI001178482C|nr:CGNR zinc finger domain-containing protein [Chitinophaga vietnamensis]
MTTEKTIGSLRLDGGILCLDFVNTIDNRKKPAPDYLHHFKDVLQWYAHVKVLPAKTIHTLERLAKEYPQKAAIVFEKSIRLRELMYQIFLPLSHHKSPAPVDLLSFNTYVADAYANAELAWSAADKQASLTFNAPALEQVNWWLTRSAVDLLSSEKTGQVRECPACGWLFLDKSRNGSRRWCSMSTCGDINKVQRFQQRNKKKTSHERKSANQ